MTVVEEGRKSFPSALRLERAKMIVVRMSSSGRSGGSKTITSDRGSVPPASTAKEAIESGLSLFSKGRVLFWTC